MPPRLLTAVAEASERLDPAAQERLAALIEATVADWADPSTFSDDEMIHLCDVAAEPFEPADPEAVRTFFNTHAR